MEREFGTCRVEDAGSEYAGVCSPTSLPLCRAWGMWRWWSINPGWALWPALTKHAVVQRFLHQIVSPLSLLLPANNCTSYLDQSLCASPLLPAVIHPSMWDAAKLHELNDKTHTRITLWKAAGNQLNSSRHPESLNDTWKWVQSAFREWPSWGNQNLLTNRLLTQQWAHRACFSWPDSSSAEPFYFFFSSLWEVPKIAWNCQSILKILLTSSAWLSATYNKYKEGKIKKKNENKNMSDWLKS